MKPALYWEHQEDYVRCFLCYHHCKIREGKTGLCGVRLVKKGQLVTRSYGMFSSVNIDPIEKKPFFHFKPRSPVLSLGTFGCNLNCDFCQNWDISQDTEGRQSYKKYSPKNVVALARKSRCNGIAWTYNEPTVWYEFILDGSKLAKRKGLFTVFVSNGYMEEGPMRELAPYLDAVNIDVKAFRDEYYRKVCHARLDKVKRTAELVKELGLHQEFSYLLVPPYNNDPGELGDFANWILERFGPSTPVHILRFFPAHKMTDTPMTPPEALVAAWETMKDTGLHHIYLNNIDTTGVQDTICPSCGETVIYRSQFNVRLYRLRDGACPKCGVHVAVVE